MHRICLKIVTDNQSEIRNFTPHLAPSSTPPTTLVMTVPTKPPTPDTAPPTAPRSPDLECQCRATVQKISQAIRSHTQIVWNDVAKNTFLWVVDSSSLRQFRRQIYADLHSVWKFVSLTQKRKERSTRPLRPLSIRHNCFQKWTTGSHNGTMSSDV